MPTVLQAPLVLKEIPATFMPPVIVMYNFLKYVSLETHEERSQKQFKLFYYWLSQKLVDDFPHAEKTAAAKVYLEKKIEENMCNRIDFVYSDFMIDILIGRH